ncbi:MAG: hypothetical protein FJ303_13035 [Planctomycetes bacterium]|nr:hypothetical protein [Planctomycetota bacterium]
MNNDQPRAVEETSSRPVALGIALIGGVVAAVLRIVPHPPNFSGVGGLGIFGGARLRAWQAFLLPVAIMFASDLGLWLCTGLNDLYSPWHLSRLYVYGGFLCYVAIGCWLSERDSIPAVAGAAVLGGIVFFVITNFFTWLLQPYEAGYELIQPPFKYSRDLDGLVTCFGYALGFYRQDTAGMDYPFMLVTNFPFALVAWTILGDIFFTSVYVLTDAKLSQPAASLESATAPTAKVSEVAV